jgi:hypothetical protein
MATCSAGGNAQLDSMLSDSCLSNSALVLYEQARQSCIKAAVRRVYTTRMRAITAAQRHNIATVRISSSGSGSSNSTISSIKTSRSKQQTTTHRGSSMHCSAAHAVRSPVKGKQAKPGAATALAASTTASSSWLCAIAVLRSALLDSGSSSSACRASTAAAALTRADLSSEPSRVLARRHRCL